MINYRFILHLLGKLLLIEAFFLFISMIIAYAYGGSDVLAFAYTLGITVVSGLSLSFFIRHDDRSLAKKDGYFIVTIVWIIFSIFGSLPYVFSDSIPSFVDAFFETMSGFTTTGSSILNNIEELPKGILFWRSLTQWLGGVGIIMLFIAILPSLGIEGRDLYIAEVTGPTVSKSSFTFKGVARQMWLIYGSLTLAQTIFLVFGGMSVYDAICHSFTTMASGGFSTKQDSIAYWDSAYIQYVIIFFMFIAGTNFSLVLMVAKGQWRKAIKDNEFLVYLFATLIISFMIAIGLYLNNWAGAEKSLRDAMFQVVTIFSTTGYATADYLQWPAYCGLLLFILLFTGSSAGSTSGGIKVIRIYLVFKSIFVELKRSIHTYGIMNVKYNGKGISPNVLSGISSFVILYIIVFLVGTLLLTIFANDLITSSSAVVTCMSNTGPGFGAVGPMVNFSGLNDISKIILSALMLIGRLELLTVLVLFTRSFWRK